MDDQTPRDLVPDAVAGGGSRTLGALAGEGAIGQVAEEAGSTSFRRATMPPFHLVLEVRR